MGHNNNKKKKNKDCDYQLETKSSKPNEPQDRPATYSLNSIQRPTA
jgi:hypothetical protein